MVVYPLQQRAVAPELVDRETRTPVRLPRHHLPSQLRSRSASLPPAWPACARPRPLDRQARDRGHQRWPEAAWESHRTRSNSTIAAPARDCGVPPRRCGRSSWTESSQAAVAEAAERGAPARRPTAQPLASDLRALRPSQEPMALVDLEPEAMGGHSRARMDRRGRTSKPVRLTVPGEWRDRSSSVRAREPHDLHSCRPSASLHPRGWALGFGLRWT